MADFKIITDATCDLPQEYAAREGVYVIPMAYTIDSKTYDGGEKNSLDPHDFYERMRGGSMATTALVNPLTAREATERFLKKGTDVLYIAFSSALSGSCQSAFLAAEELRPLYPERKLCVVDSLAASLGEGLLVHYAVLYKKAGHSLAETYEYVEKLKHQICHFFTVNDLFHLHRGGRVGKSTAIVGSLLKIKPLLHVDELGRLIPLSKIMGRKKALASLAAKMEEKGGREKSDFVFISHADCKEDAEFVRDIITEKLGQKEFLISAIGPVVGSHAGPGTVALFFLGTGKVEDKKG